MSKPIFSITVIFSLALVFTNFAYADTTIPNPPTGISATAVSPTQVNIFWTAPSGFTITGYKIDYKIANGNYATLVTTSTTNTNYAHNGLTTGTTYSYKVYAINSVGTSIASSEITATPTTSSVGALPESPRNLSVVLNSLTQATLSWTASSNGGYPITGYRIESRVGGGAYSDVVSNTGNSATTYSLSGLSKGQIYVYRVYAITSFGTSANPSTEILLKVPSSASAPSAPTSLSATAVSPTKVTLSWVTPSDGGFQITGYKIDVKKGSGTYSTLVSNTGNSTNAYSHTGLTTGTTYSYKVYAINSVGTSVPSPEASATPTAGSASSVPSAPSSLIASASSSTQINLSWVAPSNNGGSPITGYKIEFKTGTSGTYSALVANTANTATTYSHTSLTTGQTYIYRVSAINSAGTSPTSPEASATPTISSTTSTTKSAPSTPTGLIATSASSSQINLSWVAPSNNGGSPITGYKIESKKGSDSYSVLVANTGTTATTYSHVGVIASNVYYYRISAINAIGTSSPSGEASATPKDTDRPVLTATATGPTSIYLSWTTPSQTYHQSIGGFKVEEKQGNSYLVIKDNIGPVSGYLITNVITGKSHTYVVSAVFTVGASPRSNEATVTTTSTSVAPAGFSTVPTPIQTTPVNGDPKSILKAQQDEMARKAQEAMDAMKKQSGKTDSDKTIAAREAAQKANELANKNATDTIKKRIADSKAQKKLPITIPTPTSNAKLVNATNSKPRTIEEARQLAEAAKQKALAQQDIKDSSKQKQDQRDKAQKAMEAEKAAVWEKARKALEAAKNAPKK